jgi:elongation factor Tu
MLICNQMGKEDFSMAKEKFERRSRTLTWAQLVTLTMVRRRLTAAITTLWRRSLVVTAKAYDQIDAAPEERARGITIQQRTLNIESAKSSLCTRGLPRTRGLCEEHDHRCGANGRSDIGGSAADGPMPQTREHILLARQVGVPYIVVFLNKADMVDDAELLELVEMEVRDLLTSV